MARSDLRIDNFKANFDAGARPNRFKVNILGPNLFRAGEMTEAVQEETDDNGDVITEGVASTLKNVKLDIEGIRCHKATLPGRALEAHTFSEYGAERQMPFKVNDGGTASFSFYCDQNFQDRAAIEGWQDSIYGGDPIKPRFAFFEEYVGTVEISAMNTRGKETLQYTLKDAYPIKYEQQDLDYSSSDIMSFTVEIAYRSFETKYVPDESDGGGLNRGRRILDALIGIGQQTGKYTNAGQSVFKRLRGLDDKLAKVQGIFG